MWGGKDATCVPYIEQKFEVLRGIQPSVFCDIVARRGTLGAVGGAGRVRRQAREIRPGQTAQAVSDRAAASLPVKSPAANGRRGFARWRRRSGLVTALRFGGVTAFFGAWEIGSRAGWLDPLFASSPTLIVEKLVQMIADGSIWPHVLASADDRGLGLRPVDRGGRAAGLGDGPVDHHPRDARALRHGAQCLAASRLPAAPHHLARHRLTSKVALVFLGSFIIMVVNTETGVAQVDRRLVETARAFMANERQILVKIVLPAALPYIIAGMRLGVGRTLVMVVVAEIYASTKGLGYLIFQAGGLYDTAQVFVGVAILAGAGVLLNMFLRWLEKRLAPWQHVQAE